MELQRKKISLVLFSHTKIINALCIKSKREKYNIRFVPWLVRKMFDTSELENHSQIGNESVNSSEGAI